MSAPQVILEGKYVTRQSYFNGQHYNGWKNRKENYIQADDYELWMIIENGPHISVRITDDGKIVPKKPHEFDSDDFRRMKKNARAKKLLYFGLSPDEYTRIPECESTKEIWNALRVAHEGTNQVKVSGLIINGGSCINEASNTLIDKLQIPIKKHPTAYFLK